MKYVNKTICFDLFLFFLQENMSTKTQNWFSSIFTVSTWLFFNHYYENYIFLYSPPAPVSRPRAKYMKSYLLNIVIVIMLFSYLGLLLVDNAYIVVNNIHWLQ
jgi:hypothetical protein